MMQILPHWEEVKAGFSEQYKDAVLVTIGTGIGSGIVLDGKILQGGIGSMEIGHTMAVKMEKCVLAAERAV